MIFYQKFYHIFSEGNLTLGVALSQYMSVCIDHSVLFGMVAHYKNWCFKGNLKVENYFEKTTTSNMKTTSKVKATSKMKTTSKMNTTSKSK